MNKGDLSFLGDPPDLDKLNDPHTLKLAVCYLLGGDRGTKISLQRITNEVRRLQQRVVELLALLKVLIETENDATGVHDGKQSK